MHQWRDHCFTEPLNRSNSVFFIVLLSHRPVVFPMEACHTPVGKPNRPHERESRRPAGHASIDGTENAGRARTVERIRHLPAYQAISGNLLTVNQGTLYPVLLKLEQEGSIASEWGASRNNRKARFYRPTRGGRKQLRAETRGWEQTAAIIGRFFSVKAEDLK